MDSLPTPQTLQEAVEFFADPDRCHALLYAWRVYGRAAQFKYLI